MKTVRALDIKSVNVIIMALFLFFLGGQAFAATYYVSPAGNDSSSGTVSAPFKTIQKAANIVNPGDTVIVKNGTYTDTNGDNYIVKLNRSGTANNWITFAAENKWGAVLDGQNNTGYGFSIPNGSYINIEDFELKNLRNQGFHIPNNAATSNVYYYRNKVHDVARRIIGCSEGDVGIGHNGFYNPSTSSNITYDSNIIYNIGRLPGGCSLQNDHALDHGMYVHSLQTTVINNIFYNNTSGWSIQLDGRVGTSDWLVSNNTFYGANTEKDGHIIIWGECAGVEIKNNISYGPRNYFLHAGAEQNDDTVTIENNLVYQAGVINKTGSGYSISNNITGQDPKFVNLTNRDFHLQSGSPAIDKGVYIDGYDYDADSNPIVGAPDVGAYEYAGVQTDTVSPSVPAGLTAAAVSTSQINLAWTASTDNVEATGYKIYRNGTHVGTSAVASYSDSSLAASTSYTYKVSAFDAAGNVSAQSASASATTMTPPDTQAPTVPTNLIATAVSTSQINLAWTASTDNAGVTGYKIYKNGSLIATMLTTSYSDTGLTASTSYTYAVSAFDAAGNVSAQSASASAATMTPPDTQAPSVPSNLVATALSASQINLAWTASTDNIGVTGYKIFRDGTQVGTSVTASYSNTGLAASTSYTYKVSAFDAAGNVSAQSAIVSAQSATVPAATQSAVDTVIIDNGDKGTSYSGTWQSSDGANPYGTNSLWGSNGAKYTWTFKPKTSGIYEVSMWWTEFPTRSTKVPVTIVYAGSKKTLYIDQQVNGGQWNSLNSYYFKAGKSYKVMITAQPNPASTCADSVKFTYAGAK